MRAMHVKLSDEAYAAWHNFAGRHGVTVSSLIEVIGLSARIGQNQAGWTDEQVERLVTAARQVAADRRRAGGRPPNGRREQPPPDPEEA